MSAYVSGLLPIFLDMNCGHRNCCSCCTCSMLFLLYCDTSALDIYCYK